MDLMNARLRNLGFGSKRKSQTNNLHPQQPSPPVPAQSPQRLPGGPITSPPPHPPPPPPPPLSSTITATTTTTTSSSSRNPSPQSLPMNPPGGLGRPPSYTSYPPGQLGAPPQAQRTASPMPPGVPHPPPSQMIGGPPPINTATGGYPPQPGAGIPGMGAPPPAAGPPGYAGQYAHPSGAVGGVAGSQY